MDLVGVTTVTKYDHCVSLSPDVNKENRTSWIKQNCVDSMRSNTDRQTDAELEASMRDARIEKGRLQDPFGGWKTKRVCADVGLRL